MSPYFGSAIILLIFTLIPKNWAAVVAVILMILQEIVEIFFVKVIYETVNEKTFMVRSMGFTQFMILGKY